MKGNDYREFAKEVDALLTKFGSMHGTLGFWCRKYDFMNDKWCLSCEDSFVCPGGFHGHTGRKEIREREFTDGFAPHFDWVLMRLHGKYGPDNRLNSHLSPISSDSPKEAED